MTTMTLGLPQALDLLINFHGQDAINQMCAEAPSRAVPEELRATGAPQSVRDVVLHHLQAGTAPDASLTPYLDKVKQSQNTGVSGKLKSCTVSESDAEKIEDWLFVTIDTVKLIIDVFFLVEAAGELDKEALAEKHMNNAGSLLEKELRAVTKGENAWDQAMAFFKVLKKAFEFGLFQDMFHAIAADWDVWDYIKEAVLALVQIVAWLATDFVAAVAEFVEKLAAVAEDVDALCDDIGKLCSYDDAESAVTALESPIQLHTPAAVQFNDTYYVAQTLKGYHAVMVYVSTDDQLSAYKTKAASIQANLDGGKTTREQAAAEFKAISPWTSAETITFKDSKGVVHDPVGAPAVGVFQDTLFFAILTGDDSSIIEDQNEFLGEIYLTFAEANDQWAPAYKLGFIGDAGAAPALHEVNDTFYCIYRQGQNAQIMGCQSSDGRGWTVEKPILDGVATTATTPSVCTNSDRDDNYGLTITFRGSGTNVEIWQIQSNTDFAWQGPDAQCPDYFSTLGTPALLYGTNNWRFIFYKSSNAFSPDLYCGDRYPGPREPNVYKYDGILLSGSPAACGNYLFYQDQHYDLQYVDVKSCF